MNYKRLLFLVGSAVFMVVAFVLFMILMNTSSSQTSFLPFAMFLASILLSLWLLSQAGDPNIYGLSFGSRIVGYTSQPPNYGICGRAWRIANFYKPKPVCWMCVKSSDGKIGYLPFFVSAADVQIKWPVGNTYKRQPPRLRSVPHRVA